MKELPYAILWDMDGTLIDTTDMHMRSWMVTWERYGVHINKQDFMKNYGMNNQSTVLHYFPDATPEFIQSISDEKEKEFHTLVPGNTHIFPGVLNWLDYFQQKGYLQCIASSAPMSNIDIQLNETQIGHYFTYIGSGADIPGKPDPTLFLTTAEKIHLPPHQCLVIEDSPSGIEGARRAGMRCVAIKNSHASEVLAAADLIITGFTDSTLFQAEAILLG